MEFGVIEILAGIGILFLAIYYYLTSQFDFWKKKNVKGPKPIPIFGNFKDVVFGKINFPLLLKEYYDEFKSEPVFGVFTRGKPQLVVRDPDLIRDILIKDFNIFHDRAIVITDKKDPFNQNLLNLEHERWRPLRNQLSPVFSSGKLKNMFYLILDCGHEFEKCINKLVEKGEPIECRELTAKYTTDVIGVCAFGLNANALSDENSAFRKAGRELMSNSLKNVLRFMLRDWFPMVYKLVKPLIYNRAIDYFVATIKETIQYRKNNAVRRNDFVDLLTDLQNQPDKLSNFEFTNELLTSQAFIFFLAGFETSSTTMSNILYELALNPHTQEKLREEVKEIYKNDGELTYENIKSMKYLDMVVKETMRKYPPGSILLRTASAPYKFSKIDLEIPQEMRVVIPVWAIHRDPDVFPEPDKFDPERFTEDNEKKRHPMSYLPFGDGPHNCIGARFANYQVKIGIATLINKFRVDVCDKTCIPYRVHPRSFIPAPIGGIYLQISKL